MKSDAELVEAVLDGDRQAFAALVERYERPVRAVAARILRDRDAARDVAQEVFVTAYVKLASLRNGAAFGKWVCRIARHKALRLVRQRSKVVSLEASEEVPARGNPGAGPLDETSLRLLAAVARLPEHERQVVALKHFDGYSVQEVAGATGRPLGTVTKQLSRAYARLRKRLKDKD